jgi:undecaprenyl-diphosphatase
MLDAILNWDKKLLVTLNSYHAPWLDPVMLYTSKTIFWLPLYLFLLYLVIRFFKRDFWIPLTGIALTLLLTDQITSTFMKPFFERLRPSQEPGLEGIIHLVDGYKGGLYGFASSHAANTFGVAMFFWLLWSKKSKWISLLFVWAVGMTYTRIYLGVHYPGDVLVGCLIGLLAGWAGFKLFQRIANKVNARNPLA